MVKPYKPQAVLNEEALDKAVDPDIKPTVPMVLKEGVPLAPKVEVSVDENSASLYEFMRTTTKQLAELKTLCQTIALHTGTNTRGVVDDTHPAPVVAPYPPTTNGGHPIVKGPNGMLKPALFVEVPTVEQLLAQVGEYKKTHTQEDVITLVRSFGVKKISEMNEEQRSDFMEKIRG